MLDETALLTNFQLKTDTFFSSIEDGVYIRNNKGYFTIKGKNTYQWLTALTPRLDGSTNIQTIINGLTEQQQEMTIKIIQTLWEKGFLEKVSEEHHEALRPNIQKYYSSQINFIQYFQEQAISRFINYRNSKTLIIGEGFFLNSIINAALESGLSNLGILPISQTATIVEKRKILLEFYQNMDPNITVYEHKILFTEASKIKKIITDYDSVLYAPREANYALILSLNHLCKELGKNLIVASHLENVGIVGPLIAPNNSGCLECMLRTIQSSYIQRDKNQHFACSNSEAILANLTIFELFKHITQTIEPSINKKTYILDLETLEGQHHLVLPHPLCNTCRALHDNNILDERNLPKLITNLDEQITLLNNEINGMFLCFEQGDLSQLPLSQYKIQVAALTNEGHAKTLPVEIISGITNALTKREAFLRALDAYFAQYVPYLSSGEHDQIQKGAAQKCPPGVSLVLQQTSNQYLDGINISNRLLKHKIPFSILPYEGAIANGNSISSYINIAAGKDMYECIVRGTEKIINRQVATAILAQNISFDKVAIENITDQTTAYLKQLVTTKLTYYICQSFYGFTAIAIVDHAKNRVWLGVSTNLTKAFRQALINCLSDLQNNAPNNAIIVTKELCAVIFTAKKHKISIISYEENYAFETKTIIDLFALRNMDLLFVQYKDNLTSIIMNFVIGTIIIVNNHGLET